METESGRKYKLNNGKSQETRYNHGRWIIDCPFEDCNGAEIYRKDEPFICGSCNAIEAQAVCKSRGLDPRKHLVIITKEIAAERGEVFDTSRTRQWKKIEELVRLRPLDNMNWELGESVEKLKAENIMNGIKEL